MARARPARARPRRRASRQARDARAAPADAAAAERAGLRLPSPPVPTAQYVPAVAAGGLLFVSGHDPERRGRLAYRGRIGREVIPARGRAAARLATLNALASAEAALGSLARARRAVLLTCFLDALPEALSPALATGAIALLRAAFGAAPDPIVCLRPARGLAGGMPVEVELVLELSR